MSEPEIERIMAMVGIQDETSAFEMYDTTYRKNYTFKQSIATSVAAWKF
jgi:hypothetical protein